MDFLDTIGRLKPSFIAAFVAVITLAFSLFDELGGFAIEKDQDDRSLIIGLIFTVIWLVLLYFPPKTRGKAKGEDKDAEKGSD